ncbi:biosynthetic peptidoglycan transglycosylase [Variovorax sp. YR752]|uniref:biosynthetic peptidoglycan transglycosylase n=1 Tax=Variovorax sp. YR752 TaxID=1884383 RepID=UPI003137E47D
MKKILLFVLGLLLAVLLIGAAMVWLTMRALAPQPGEWATTLHIGGTARQASVPTLLRWASHPLALPRLDGRRVGEWQLQRIDDHTLEAHCAPCRVQLDALGPHPLRVAAARLRVHVRGADRFDGSLRLGAGAGAVNVAWRAELKREGLQLQAELPNTPLARVLAVFGNALPEARTARIEGSVAVRAEATLGAQGLHFTKLKPTLADVSVDGLGTESLRDADAGARCRPQPAIGRIEGWIQNAVIAAEDQRFFEHPGYELDAWVAVLKANQREGEPLQGASTIPQQLAKLLYTGDQRDPVRKLREWLYAVEMERTLGKGRILQLYLAVLPWGDGICGAEAASRHHLGKPANQLKPREAAWLASLLVNPDQQLRRWALEEEVARERAAWVLKGIKRLPRERREAELDALVSWRPPIGRR